jgi:hypothetical protein
MKILKCLCFWQFVVNETGGRCGFCIEMEGAAIHADSSNICELKPISSTDAVFKNRRGCGDKLH